MQPSCSRSDPGDPCCPKPYQIVNPLIDALRNLNNQTDTKQDDFDDYQFSTMNLKQEEVELVQQPLWIQEPAAVAREEVHPDVGIDFSRTVEISPERTLQPSQPFEAFVDIVCNSVVEFIRRSKDKIPKNRWGQIETEIVDAHPQLKTVNNLRNRLSWAWSNGKIRAENKKRDGQLLTRRDMMILEVLKEAGECSTPTKSPSKVPETTPATETSRPSKSSAEKSKSRKKSSAKTLPLFQVACEMAAPHARFMKVGQKAHNAKFWIQIERELLKKYPTFKREKRLRVRLQAAFWRCRSTALKKRKKGLKLTENEEITLQVQEPPQQPNTSTPKTEPKNRPTNLRSSSRKNLEKQNKSLPNLQNGEDDDIIFIENDGPIKNIGSTAKNETKGEGKIKFNIRSQENLREDPDFIRLVVETVAAYASQLKTRMENGCTANIKVWLQIEEDVLKKHPELERVDDIRQIVRNVWHSCKYKAMKRKRDKNIPEVYKLVLEALKKSHKTENTPKSPTKRTPSPPKKKPRVENEAETLDVTVPAASPSRNLRTRDTVGPVANTSATVDHNSFQEPEASDTVSNPPTRSNTPKDSSVAPAQITKSLPFSNLLKVVDFCKRTNHEFHLNGEELVFRDRDNPANELRFPIDRVDQLA